MPPKKVEEPERKPLIGRVGTNLRVGIVGVPNVGKSTFFNVLTKSAVAAENFPFCTINPNEKFVNRDKMLEIRKDYYNLELEDNPISNYGPCQTSIINTEYLKYIKGCAPCRKIKETIEEPYLNILSEKYPATNTYYVYTEDVGNDFRVGRYYYTPYSSQISFKNNNNNFSFSSNFNDSTTYSYQTNSTSEYDVKINYLSTPPVSFIFLGKPDIGQADVGKLLAEFWKCVYIDPHTLIADEVNAETRAGKCIEYNLRCGRAIGKEIILRLLEKRMKSQSVLHRGAVVCGFPLIETLMHEADPVSSESAVFNVVDIFDEVMDVTIATGIPPQVPSESSMIKKQQQDKVSKASDDEEDEDEDEEEKEEENEEEDDDEDKLENSSVKSGATTLKDDVLSLTRDVGSATGSIVRKDEDKETSSFEGQVQRIFKCFNKNLVIVYFKCENEDARRMHQYYRFDLGSKREVNEYHLPEKDIFTVHLQHAHEHLSNRINITSHLLFTETIATSEPSQKHTYMFQLPKDLKENVMYQLNMYHYYVQPILEKIIIQHNQELIIKVDARANPLNIYNDIRTRLKVLPLQKVIVPERLSSAGGRGGGVDADDTAEMLGEGEEIAEELDLDGKKPEECFDVLCDKHIVSSMFKWQWSIWKGKCPVAMNSGENVLGDPRYAVHFMNNVFFLKDEDAYWKFYRNPRPFLLPPNPRLRCRIFIMGPKYSGKSVLAKSLGIFLKGKVLHPEKLKQRFIQYKLEKIRDQIRNAAIAEALQLLENENEDIKKQQERDHEKKVKAWKDTIVTYLNEYLALDSRYSEEAKAANDSDSIRYDAFSSFAVKMKRESEQRTINPEEQRYYQLMDKLERKGISTDREFLLRLLVDPMTGLEPYIPKYLKNMPSPSLDVHHPFVTEYVNRKLKEASLSGSDEDLTPSTLAEMYEEAIAEIEEASMERDNVRSGWIIDGMSLDLELLKAMKPEYIADYIVFLDDSGTNHEFLINQFARFQKGSVDFDFIFHEIGVIDIADKTEIMKDAQHVAENLMNEMIQDAVPVEDIEEDIQLKERKLEEYKASVLESQQRWEEINNYFISIDKHPLLIDISNLNVTEIVKDTLSNILDENRLSASPFTEQERAEELRDFSPVQPKALDDEEEAEEEMEEEGEETEGATGAEDLFFANRRFGETLNYCPVTFSKHFILCKGKEEFSAKFLNKIYLMRNEQCWKEFLKYPHYYVGSDKEHYCYFPPPRIFVVGRRMSGKTMLSRKLARELGLYYVSFDKIILEALHSKAARLDDVSSEDVEFVRNYLENGDSLEQYLMKTFIDKIFFEEPIKSTGFVVDGFPRRPSDVEFLTVDGTVPDLIFDISVDDLTRHERIVEEGIVKWKYEREIAIKHNQDLMNDWKEAYKSRLSNLLDIAKNERYNMKLAKKMQEMDFSGSEEGDWDIKSQVSYDSVQEEADVKAAEEQAQLELPPPALKEWTETEEEARSRLYTNLIQTPDSDTQFLTAVRDFCDSELIKWTIVDGKLALDKLVLLCVRECESVKFRNMSFFERCYDVSLETAEKLLECGYFFLSNFGYTCPVQVYEKKNFVQMFIPAEEKNDLYPIINRSYIYFLAGKDSRNKFKGNCLKYLLNVHKSFPLVPVQIAIIGPPKSGKTTLATRFRQDLGLKVITRGSACRYVMKMLSRSELKRDMGYVLRMGWELTDEMVARAVDAACMDGRAIAQGFVLDGFPNTELEIKSLNDLGRLPHLILYVNADEDLIEQFRVSQKMYKEFPTMTSLLLNHYLDEWKHAFEHFRPWVQTEYQNLVEIQVRSCKWGVWSLACEALNEHRKYLLQYCTCIFKNYPAPLRSMCVTPEEFDARVGFIYSWYCPGCLARENILNKASNPPDRTGSVQYYHNFFWLCDDHYAEFLVNPALFFFPYTERTLPIDLPRVCSPPENASDTFRKGLCVSCYFSNEHRRVIKKGTHEFCARLGEFVYLFDTRECLDTFLKKSHQFAEKIVRYSGEDLNYPSLSYEELPTLGMLEQYAADILVKAITNTGIHSKVPAFLNVVDIAGLVKGASEGQGLGNAFLSHISACDAIFHLCRAFEDDDVTHVEGEVNPVRDLDIICEELRLKDEDSLMKNLDKMERTVGRGGDKKLKPEYDCLIKIKSILVEEKQHIRFADWHSTEIEILNKYLFLTSKPAIYLVNLAEKDYIRKKNKWLPKIKEWVDKNDPGALIIPFSGAFEHKLVEMEDPEEQKKYMEDTKCTSALDKIIVQGYKALQLEYFFTSGADEVKAWTIQKGTKAPQAAGRIHTDFEKGFIMAEVMKFADFKEEGTETAVKAAGKYRQQGRNYVVEDGDIIFFKFNAGAGLKDAKKK